MSAAEYIDGYPVPALLYDAEAGNTHSRLLIFDYFATLTERGEPVRADIAGFVAKQLRQVIDQRQTPRQMFNPERKKLRTYDPLPASFLALFDVDGDMHAKFEKIAEQTGMDENTVKKRFYDHRDYSQRLRKIQALLDERERGPKAERALKISRELISLTRKA